jgi:Tol biopolymer transport system component
MGQVYRALDTRLNRTVALKILPAEYRADPALKQRFDREARTIAALNHPHICVLHDIGEQNGIAFIVMEYLEGETLASRVSRGPLPVEEVFGYSIQIADALDRAHRHGVIHRDLKPANVMLTRSGTKLLDFGLARAPADHLFSNETHPPGSTPITEQGALVGTLQYMSPEQLEGRPVDARTDLFALGAVIYEIATGERAFPGDSQASIIASILNRTPPPPSSRQLVSPPALDHIVARALAKDPEERWQTARDVLLELRTRLGERPPVVRSSPVPPIAWLLAGLVVLGIAGSGLLTNFLRRSAPAPVAVRATIAPPEHMLFQLTGDFGGPPAVAPDGRSVAFAAVDPLGKRQIWIRRLDTLTPEVLPGTDDGTFPFWSPDSRSIAFFAGGQLKRLNLDAGSALTLSEAPGGRGGSWSPQGVILFSPGVRGGLQQVPAEGGAPSPVTSTEGTTFTSHRWPQFLPDGRHFVYLAAQQEEGRDQSAVFLGTLGGRAPQMLLRSRSQAVFANGQLLFLRDRTLWAQPFDSESAQLNGAPVALARDVLEDPTIWCAVFSVNDSGTLVYQTGQAGTALTLYDRDGHELGPVGEHGIMFDVNISPDGKRVAVNRGEPADIWVYELGRGTSLRLTFDPRNETLPVWSPDGHTLAYARIEPDGRAAVVQVPSTGGEPTVMIPPGYLTVTDWSRDGKYLLLRQGSLVTGPVDMYAAPADAPTHARPLLETNFVEYHARFSPDGRWVSYVSNESGRDEVYVMRFRPPMPGMPAPTIAGGRVRISTAGGTLPRWRADQTELYYLAADLQVMAARVDGKGETFTVHSVAPLFSVNPKPAGWAYDVTADGQRFIVNSLGDEGRRPLVLVTDWASGLTPPPR